MNQDFHLYLDSADMAELQACLPHPVVHGVTTNPTLLRRAGIGRADVPGLLRRCIELGARQVQAQVYSQDADGMLEDARALLAHFAPGQLVVKIPATRQGFAAGARLIEQACPLPGLRFTRPSRPTSRRSWAPPMPRPTSAAWKTPAPTGWGWSRRCRR